MIHEIFSRHSCYARLTELRKKIGSCTDYNQEPHELINETVNSMDLWRDCALHELIKSGFTQEILNKELLHKTLDEMAHEFVYLEKNHMVITNSSDAYFIRQIADKAHELKTSRLADYIEEVGMRKYFEGTEDNEIFDRAQILAKILEINEAFVAYKEYINLQLANIDAPQTSPCYQKLEYVTQTIPVCCHLKTEKIGHISDIDLLSSEDILQLLEKHDALIYEERGCDGAVVEVCLIIDLELLSRVDKSKDSRQAQERG